MTADAAPAPVGIDWPRLFVAALVAPLVLLVAAPLVVFVAAAMARAIWPIPSGLRVAASPIGYLVLALFVGVVALLQGYVLTFVLCLPTYLALIRLQARRRLALVAAASIGFLAESAIAAVLALANPRPAPHPLSPIVYAAVTFPFALCGALVSLAFWLLARPRPRAAA